MTRKIVVSVFLALTISLALDAQWQETTISSQANHQLSSMASDNAAQVHYLGESLTLDIPQGNAGVMFSLAELSFISNDEGTHLSITGQSGKSSIEPLVFSSSMDEGHMRYLDGEVELFKSGKNDILILFNESVESVTFTSSHPYVRFEIAEMLNLPSDFALLPNAKPDFRTCDGVKIDFLIDRSSSMDLEDYQEVKTRMARITAELAGSGVSYEYQLRDLSTGESMSSIVDLVENTNKYPEDLTDWKLDSEADIIILLTDGMPNDEKGEKINLTKGFAGIFSDLNQARKNEQNIFFEPIGKSAPLMRLQELVNRSSSTDAFSAWLRKAESCESELITLAPNPTNGILYITGDLTKIDEIKLIDASGNVLKEIKSPKRSSIDLSSLPSGIYQVQIHKGGKISTRPIIKID